LVRIEHKVRSKTIGFRSQVGAILEHLRFSGSRVREWNIDDKGNLKLKAVYKGTAVGWRMVKERAGSFIYTIIEDEHRYSEDDGSYFPINIPEDAIRQCLKCRYTWKHKTHLRKSGKIALRCPNCNSNLTMDTSWIKTKVWKREDLLMLTDGQYPEKFCPKTNTEEISGVLIDKVGKSKLTLGRGFERPKHGHKIILITKKGHQMDSNYNERQSMKGAVAWCSENSRVFIGGLGLGLILLYLAKTGKSREVVVCEIDEDVISLVKSRLRRWFDTHYPNFNWKVVHGDALVEVLKGEPYDWIFMDIWKSSQDYKLMQKAEEIAKRNLTSTGRVTCWMKDNYEKRQRRFEKWKSEREKQ